MAIPEYYRAPLRSRKKIIAFFRDRRVYNGFQFWWNVKVRSLDLSLQHLYSVYRSNGDSISDDQANIANQVYDQTDMEELCDRAIEFTRTNVVDNDGYNTLYDGTELSVVFEFQGRSGGQLVLTEFEGVRLLDWFDECSGDFVWLKKLYKFIVQCDHDFSPALVKREIEWQVAFIFFDRIDNEVVLRNQEESQKLVIVPKRKLPILMRPLA